MSKLILFVALTINFCSFAQTACSYCTSMEDALVKPEQVTHLDLHAQGLKKLPEGIEKLVNLTALDLSENMLNEIPFGNYAWPFLRELDLSYNPGFNTVELDGIGKTLPNLQFLDLSHCNVLVLSPAIAEMSLLKSINLNDNSIVHLPIEMEKLKQLTVLNVGSNNLKSAAFLSNLWRIEYLDLSGNWDLDLREVGTALYFKPTLKELIITPDDKLKFGIPQVFGEIPVEHLTLKDGTLNQVESRLSGNKELLALTFDNIIVEDAKKFVSSLNRLSKLETVEFKNMTVPSMIDQLTGVKKMQFVYSDFENLTELKNVKSSIDITAIGTNITDGDYVGNSKTAKLGERNQVVQRTETMPLSTAMLENNVEPIVVPSVQKLVVKGDTPCIVNTKSSEFVIPNEAFLTESGEVYTGEVAIEVIEYMDPVLNALSGAPMVYQTSTGNEIFASSGMMDFRAYDEKGNELKPNPERIIQVQMEDLQPAQESEFYTFDEETNNWDLGPLPRPSDFLEQKAALLDSLNRLSAEEITGFQVVPIGIFLKYKKSSKDPYQLNFYSNGKAKALRRIKGEAQQIYTSNPEQKWIAKRKTWKIDTLVSPEMVKLLDSIKSDQRKAAKYWKKKSGPKYEFSPRIIRDLTIEPNFDQDNYSLRFAYRDSHYRIPVVISLTGSVSQIQAKEKRNFQVFQKAQRIGDKERKVIDEYKEKELQRYAAMRRSMIRSTSQLNYDDAQSSLEYNRFGLTSFGLTNCDYFSRNIPDGFVAFDSTGVDQDGNSVLVPRDVRSIYMDDNSYVSTTSIDVPVFKNRKSILLFLISSIEIAIVKGWEVLSNGFVRPKVERISIEGLSPDQVSKKIMDVGR